MPYSYGSPYWGDLLRNYDGTAITYDGIGNPLSDGTWTYAWEHGRELASMTDGTTTWDYTYNADGLRVSRTDGDTTYEYVYLDGQLVKLVIDETEVFFAYDASGRPMSFYYTGSSFYYYVTNLQGDVVGIIDKSGNLLVSYTYDAWGNILSVTGSKAAILGYMNPLTYRGYVYDWETGLYYLESRYYNPEWGRFINADSFVSTVQGFVGNNMFAYCRSNPVCRKDISGATDVEIFDDDSNLLDEEKSYEGGQMNNGGSNGGTKGFGHSSSSAGNASSSVTPIAQSNASNQTTALQPYYPPNDGFMGEVQRVTLQPGTFVQRTGGLGGKYIAPAGTPTQQLSLPYEQLG